MADSCDNRSMRAMLVPYVERVLAKANVADVEKHLKECPACAAEVGEIRKTINGLSGLVRSGSRLELRPHPSVTELYNFAVDPELLGREDVIVIGSHVQLCEECQQKIALLQGVEEEFGRRVAADGLARRVPASVMAAILGEEASQAYHSQETPAEGVQLSRKRGLFQELAPRFNLMVAGFVALAFCMGAFGVYYAFSPSESETVPAVEESVCAKPTILSGWLAQVPVVKDEARLAELTNDLRECGVELTVDNLKAPAKALEAGGTPEALGSMPSLPIQRDPKEWKLLYITQIAGNGGKPETLTATYMPLKKYQDAADWVAYVDSFFINGRRLGDSEGAPHLSDIFPGEDTDAVFADFKERLTRAGVAMVDFTFDDVENALSPEELRDEHAKLCQGKEGTMVLLFVTDVRRVYVDTCRYLVDKRLVELLAELPARLGAGGALDGGPSAGPLVPQLSDSEKVNALMRELKNRDIEVRVLDKSRDDVKGYSLLFCASASDTGVVSEYYVGDDKVAAAHQVLDELGISSRSVPSSVVEASEASATSEPETSGVTSSSADSSAATTSSTSTDSAVPSRESAAGVAPAEVPAAAPVESSPSGSVSESDPVVAPTSELPAGGVESESSAVPSESAPASSVSGNEAQE